MNITLEKIGGGHERQERSLSVNLCRTVGGKEGVKKINMNPALFYFL